MNTSITTSSRRRLRTTVAIAASAVAVILTWQPAMSAAIPEPVRPVSGVVQKATASVDPVGPQRPCFLVHARWNTALDGPQPTCATPVDVGPATPRVLRADLDVMP